MWQRFSERARKIVFNAQEEAMRMDTSDVDTEHLLLGLLSEEGCVACHILIRMNHDLEAIRGEVIARIMPGEGYTSGTEMQLTPRAKRVIDLAHDEANQLDNKYIGTEHLLLGLIAEESGVAGQALAQVGVTLEATREVVKSLQDNDSGLPHMTPANANSPANDESDPVPLRGDIGILKHRDHRAVVELLPDQADIAVYDDCRAIKDHFLYRELVSAGRVWLLPSGTAAKLLGMDEPNAYFIRLLSGDHAGKTGYVLRWHLQEFHADDRPFPPDI